jgi:hypothetical protein
MQRLCGSGMPVTLSVLATPAYLLHPCPFLPQMHEESLLVPGQRQLMYVQEDQLDRIIQDQGRAVLACLQNPTAGTIPKLLSPARGSWAVAAAVGGVQRLPGSNRALIRLLVTDRVAVQVRLCKGGGGGGEGGITSHHSSANRSPMVGGVQRLPGSNQALIRLLVTDRAAVHVRLHVWEGGGVLVVQCWLVG